MGRRTLSLTMQCQYLAGNPQQQPPNHGLGFVKTSAEGATPVVYFGNFELIAPPTPMEWMLATMGVAGTQVKVADPEKALEEAMTHLQPQNLVIIVDCGLAPGETELRDYQIRGY